MILGEAQLHRNMEVMTSLWRSFVNIRRRLTTLFRPTIRMYSDRPGARSAPSSTTVWPFHISRRLWTKRFYRFRGSLDQAEHLANIFIEDKDHGSYLACMKQLHSLIEVHPCNNITAETLRSETSNVILGTLTLLLCVDLFSEQKIPRKIHRV